MQKNNFVIYCGLFGILTGLVLGGCGKAEENVSEPLTEPEGNSTAPDVIYTEPPFLELYNISDDAQSVTLRSRGYNWTYLESEDIATSGIADSAYILDDISHLETLILPEDDSGIQAYTVSVAKLPDELGFTAWDIADAGEHSENVNPIETCSYSMEEITAPDFSISLQSGRIYEIYMEWNEDKLAENGFSGIAYYGVKTAGEEPIENELTEKANDILISIDDSYSITVHNSETGEEVFTNHTNEEYTFGDDYELQVWQDGEWRKIDYLIDNSAFNAIGYSLAGNSSVGWGVKWTYFHGILPDGQYRITKTINKGTGKEVEKYRLAAEFTITNISSRF